MHLTTKHYRCDRCGERRLISTSHYQDCFSMDISNHCFDCPEDHQTHWVCLDETPPDHVEEGVLIEVVTPRPYDPERDYPAILAACKDAGCMDATRVQRAMLRQGIDDSMLEPFADDMMKAWKQLGYWPGRR